jgi:uncharacterized protein (TIGR04141 family)
MNGAKPKSQRLSIHLMKEQYLDFEDVVKPDVSDYPVTIEGQVVGHLYVKASPAYSPSWLSLFRDNVEGLPTDALKNRNVSAALLVKRNDRIFALTFGYGRSLLKPGAWEERFGLIVVLNTIDSDKVRVIERKTLDTMLTQTRTQTSRECALEEFNLDVKQMFLRAVTGEPRDESLATRIAGADALSITCRTALPGIPDKCDQVYSAFLLDDYQRKFPWVENISQVTNKGLIETLNNELIRRIQTGQLEKVYLAVPEIIEWTAIDGFRFREAGASTLPDIYLEDFLQTVGEHQTISARYLKGRHVFQVSAAGGIAEKRWTVFHCLNCEINLDGKVYLLTEGKWYEIDASFVEEVNTAMAQIRKTTIPLAARRNEKENSYCQRLFESDADYYALMDGKNIQYGGGPSKIEFCDLYTQDGKLIHLKRYSGSSALSHLFNQGMNSAKVMKSDLDFVQKVNEELPASHRLPIEQPINPRDYEVVFGIISATAEDLPDKLPFFSKISLMRAMEDIQRVMGYSASFAGIEIS